jgi:hypothetical protein
MQGPVLQKRNFRLYGVEGRIRIQTQYGYVSLTAVMNLLTGTKLAIN